MSTELTSELTHFNLVIRLSKVKKVALRFTSLLGLSRCSCGPRVPRRNTFLSECSRVKQSETPVFLQLQLLKNGQNSKAGSRLQVW